MNNFKNLFPNIDTFTPDFDLPSIGKTEKPKPLVAHPVSSEDSITEHSSDSHEGSSSTLLKIATKKPDAARDFYKKILAANKTQASNDTTNNNTSSAPFNLPPDIPNNTPVSIPHNSKSTRAPNPLMNSISDPETMFLNMGYKVIEPVVQDYVKTKSIPRKEEYGSTICAFNDFVVFPINSCELRIIYIPSVRVLRLKPVFINQARLISLGRGQPYVKDIQMFPCSQSNNKERDGILVAATYNIGVIAFYKVFYPLPNSASKELEYSLLYLLNIHKFKGDETYCDCLMTQASSQLYVVRFENSFYSFEFPSRTIEYDKSSPSYGDSIYEVGSKLLEIPLSQKMKSQILPSTYQFVVNTHENRLVDIIACYDNQLLTYVQKTGNNSSFNLDSITEFTTDSKLVLLSKFSNELVILFFTSSQMPDVGTVKIYHPWSKTMIMCCRFSLQDPAGGTIPEVLNNYRFKFAYDKLACLVFYSVSSSVVGFVPLFPPGLDMTPLLPVLACKFNTRYPVLDLQANISQQNSVLKITMAQSELVNCCSVNLFDAVRHFKVLNSSTVDFYSMIKGKSWQQGNVSHGNKTLKTNTPTFLKSRSSRGNTTISSRSSDSYEKVDNNPLVGSDNLGQNVIQQDFVANNQSNLKESSSDDENTRQLSTGILSGSMPVETEAGLKTVEPTQTGESTFHSRNVLVQNPSVNEVVSHEVSITGAESGEVSQLQGDISSELPANSIQVDSGPQNESNDYFSDTSVANEASLNPERIISEPGNQPIGAIDSFELQTVVEAIRTDRQMVKEYLERSNEESLERQQLMLQLLHESITKLANDVARRFEESNYNSREATKGELDIRRNESTNFLLEIKDKMTQVVNNMNKMSTTSMESSFVTLKNALLQQINSDLKIVHSALKSDFTQKQDELSINLAKQFEKFLVNNLVPALTRGLSEIFEQFSAHFSKQKSPDSYSSIHGQKDVHLIELQDKVNNNSEKLDRIEQLLVKLESRFNNLDSNLSNYAEKLQISSTARTYQQPQGRFVHSDRSANVNYPSNVYANDSIEFLDDNFVQPLGMRKSSVNTLSSSAQLHPGAREFQPTSLTDNFFPSSNKTLNRSGTADSLLSVYDTFDPLSPFQSNSLKHSFKTELSEQQLKPIKNYLILGEYNTAFQYAINLYKHRSASKSDTNSVHQLSMAYIVFTINFMHQSNNLDQETLSKVSTNTTLQVFHIFAVDYSTISSLSGTQLSSYEFDGESEKLKLEFIRTKCWTFGNNIAIQGSCDDLYVYKVCMHLLSSMQTFFQTISRVVSIEPEVMSRYKTTATTLSLHAKPK